MKIKRNLIDGLVVLPGVDYIMNVYDKNESPMYFSYNKNNNELIVIDGSFEEIVIYCHSEKQEQRREKIKRLLEYGI